MQMRWPLGTGVPDSSVSTTAVRNRNSTGGSRRSDSSTARGTSPWSARRAASKAASESVRWKRLSSSEDVDPDPDSRFTARVRTCRRDMRPSTGSSVMSMAVIASSGGSSADSRASMAASTKALSSGKACSTVRLPSRKCSARSGLRMSREMAGTSWVPRPMTCAVMAMGTMADTARERSPPLAAATSSSRPRMNARAKGSSACAAARVK